ncbi:hypothetical protein H6X68_05540 [Actinomyces sp. 186855]|nr:hypothetical protein [Actinomyces sp. 187325]MCL3792051.1 hypothetical protein [Actinomyces sp. 186855]MCL3793992.1 hypothetical protein [Actinomyces sp. 217892]
MSAAPLLAGLLLALAIAVLLLPARREAPAGPAGAAAGPGVFARRGRGRHRAPDVALLLTEVATLLRAGATTQRAWQRGLERAGLTEGAVPDDDGVPPALRALAAPPGRRPGELLRRLSDPDGARRRREAAAAVPGAVAACRLTAALGAPLAGVLEAVAEGVADSARAEASRATALSGPRATARLLAGLPLLGLALGAGVGARPLQVLLDGGWGSALGAGGLVLMAVGHAATTRLVRAAEQAEDGVDEALCLDLACAALGAGASVPGCLEALGRALEEDALGVVGRALLLGASWEAAWQAPEHTGAAEARRWRHRREGLELSLRPGWEDGASPAPLLTARAAALRAGRQAAEREAAERLAVRLVVPLGLCHLPAFLLLAIVPVVLSVGSDLLAG